MLLASLEAALSILDPKWLVFVKVADLGSLTRTTVALGVPQSQISRHIAQLERQCGARLFRRTGRGVVLTEFGQQLFPRIKALIAEADALADDIRTSGGLPMGEVRVGLLPYAVTVFAGPLFGAVRERFPKVQLHLTEGASTQLEERLREGRLDMSLLLREDGTPRGDEPVIARVPLHLVGPCENPLLRQRTIEFKQLRGLPLILPSQPHVLRSQLARLADDRGFKLTVAMEADSIQLQYEIAAAGGGYAITVRAPGRTADPRLAAARIIKPPLLRAVILGSTPRQPQTLATREVYRLIQQMAPQYFRR